MVFRLLLSRLTAFPAQTEVRDGSFSISQSFPWLSPTEGQVTYVLLTRPPLVTRGASSSVLPSDLHVLGLPPAFNLSHDQTLQFNV